MPKPNPKTHTVKSVELVAARLTSLAASIKVSQGVMEEEPPMNEVEVQWQTALDVGLDRLQTWADALRDAVDTKRMQLAVSVSPGKPAKPRK